MKGHHFLGVALAAAGGVFLYTAAISFIPAINPANWAKPPAST
jgi:zinc transporter ZupT